MTKAIRIHETGGPEVMRWEDVPTPEPGPGEVAVRHEAIGLNFVDVYFRSGHYKAPSLPFTPGLEGAGTVVAVGSGVAGFKKGDRVCYGTGAMGAYATERAIAAERLLKLPDKIDFKTAAAMMLAGMTAEYLIRRTYRIKQGETILVHAAAGGVGLILCQWAKHLGVHVIGVVSTEAKAKLARANGCEHVLVQPQDLPAEVKRITGGAMLPVVYDGVGKDTFMASLDSLAPLGMMVSFGSASGGVPPFDISILASKGSLFLTRPTLSTYAAKRVDLEKSAAELFAVVESGAVKIHVNQTFPLANAADAQRALVGRKTTGSTVLIP